ncbi:MAG TPA: hypothetical protein VHZ03_46285 [Trebonia sp.]|jgi:serine/threonine protein kinase|nr:hypothetical protein [Trebonia sp.]
MNDGVLSDHDAPSPWVPGSVVLGEFFVERPLGRGGFGRVELVQSRHSGHRYVVKWVLVNDALAQARFLTEARNEDGIAKITDFGLTTTREQSVQEVVQAEVILDYIAGGPDVDEATREVIKRTLKGQFATGVAETIEARPSHTDTRARPSTVP